MFIVRIDSVLYPCFINVSKIESMMTNFVLVDIDFPNLTLEYKFITQVYFCLDLISRLCLNDREQIKEKGEKYYLKIKSFEGRARPQLLYKRTLYWLIFQTLYKTNKKFSNSFHSFPKPGKVERSFFLLYFFLYVV